MRSKPFSLDKMAYEAIRRGKRKQMLLWSLPVMIVIFLFSLWFILPSVLTGRSISAYKGSNYSAARNWLTPLTWSSPERFVIAFNSGTADIAKKNYIRAESELSQALALAPADKRCMAARNLVFAFESHASTTEHDEKMASKLTTQAKSIRSSNQSCFKGGASGGGSGQSSSSATSQSPSEAQQQQLEQKEQEGRDRQEQFARDEEYSPDDPSIKPW